MIYITYIYMEYGNILTLRPIPPQQRICPTWKQTFVSRLKKNAGFYKTCSECRYNIRQQGKKHRDDVKKVRSWIIYIWKRYQILFLKLLIIIIIPRFKS